MTDEIRITVMPYSEDIIKAFAIYGEGIVGVYPAREEYAEISPEEVKALTERGFGDSNHKGRSKLPPHPGMTNRAARRARAANNRKPRP